MWLLVLVACAHRVTLVSNPPAATIHRDGERVGVTPVEIEVRPFHPAKVVARHPGHRPLTVTVRAGLRLRPHTVELRLVEEHAGVGTWAAEDVE